MTDYQTSLLNSDRHTVNSLDARCADNQEALGFARRMLDGGGHADVWTGTRCIGQVPEASGADIKVLGQSWASQPLSRA